jgi:murein L,D-transpeptidase YcbB/YkuD
MTSTTSDKVSVRDTLAAAENVYKSTQAAADAALAAASRRELDDAEAAAAQAISAAITGEGDRASVDAARERVEKLRRDHEWAAVELAAAERATGSAYDDVVRARRGVVAEEYLAAHKVHNDPKARVNVLQAELPGLIVEFVELAEARDALHARLAQELQHLTADERAAVNIPAGQPVVAVGQTGPRLVFVHSPALVEVLREAGLEVGGR